MNLENNTMIKWEKLKNIVKNLVMQEEITGSSPVSPIAGNSSMVERVRLSLQFLSSQFV